MTHRVQLAGAFAACLATCPVQAWAHGTGWRLTDEKAVTVELYYADGEQMPFADVNVFSPGDETVPVLHGRADARGRIAFVPDQNGVWTLTASDGDGHSLRAPIPVTLEAPASPAAGRVSLELRLVLFASVLMNVVLGLFAWRRLSAGRRRGHGVAAE